jgi:2-oxoglutaroyl-CoA hydrolase
MTEYDGFRVARENDRGVATITLDVPDKLNRVSMPARDELARVFAELGEDDAVRVVVLRGAGDQAFTAGGDVGMFMERDAEMLSHLHVNVGAPERCPKPVIAQLHGYCFGVGLELALACDFRVASDDVQLALPELTLGMIPGSGGASRLVKLIGASRTKEVVMRGRRVAATEAQAWGLLCEVVPRDELGAAVASLADELAARPALALRTAKRVIGQAQEAPLAVAMELEGLAYGLLRSTDDFAEGVAAFAERRPPKYTGS